MAEKSNMPYLAIVVLVAVVVLVLNFRPSSEDAVAGEAIKLASIKPKLDCQSFLNTQVLGERLEFQRETYDALCVRQGYEQCVGVAYYGTFGPGPFRDPAEKVASTMAMPGTCELSFAGESQGVASYFDTTATNFGLNVEIDCCRLR
ncbi:MAG: hypothetical protein Q8R53_04980 [Nanoarchaeota archaeon]|nr:hypothetical protein [Nanoarchaeota archaeon]